MSKKVYISYGWTEGPRHSQCLQKCLTDAGFALVGQASEADIVIAHSGGCFTISPTTAPTILHINPTYWPGKSLIGRFHLKVRQDLLTAKQSGKLRNWLSKSVWNLYYFIALPQVSVRMYRASKQIKNLRLAKHTLIVRNDDDPWCTPAISQYLPKKVKVISLPGTHDDCWENPTAYIALLQSMV